MGANRRALDEIAATASRRQEGEGKKLGDNKRQPRIGRGSVNSIKRNS
jgi:hypothetical protein